MRLSFLTVAVVLTIAARDAPCDPIERTALGSRTVRLVYEATATPPAGAHVFEVWLPLPREDDQQILDLQLGGSIPLTVVRLASGDRAAYVRLENPNGPVTLRATATVARHEVWRPFAASRATVADVDRVAWANELAASTHVQLNDEVRAIARRESAKGRTVVEKARALYDWVFDHMQYDKSVPGWGLGDIPYCLKVGKGNCTDFHTLFIALARASGIPARWNIGFPLAYGDGKAAAAPQEVQGYHCWAEFYAPGAGWVPVDISEARKHPEMKDYFFGALSGNRVLFTRVRDQPVEPDANGRAVNYLVYPLARADGDEVAGVQWKLHYTDGGM
jgi:transglutaminase-like putative cysteine protease